MNHPSIGGREQEPQSSDVPKELRKAVAKSLAKNGNYWSVTGSMSRSILQSIPPGWMKLPSGTWVTLHPVNLDWGMEEVVLDALPDYSPDQLYSETPNQPDR